MQVFFKTGAKKVLPKSEGLTLLHYKSVDLYFVRKYFVPPRTEHNAKMGSIFKNLKVIWNSLPVEYKEQLKHSAELYNAQYRQDMYPINSYAFFTKLMFDWKKQNADIDLAWGEIINYQLLIINGGEEKEIIDWRRLIEKGKKDPKNCELVMLNGRRKRIYKLPFDDPFELYELDRRFIAILGDSFLSREEIFLERALGA